MILFHFPGAGPDARGGVTRGEKRRLIGLVAAFVLVLVLFGLSLLKSRAPAGPGSETLPASADELPAEAVDLPEIDPARFEALVHDRRPEDRVVLESEAIDAAFDVARLLTPRHFEAMATPVLDAAGIAAIAAAPSAHRGSPRTLRGWAGPLQTRRRTFTGAEEHIGRVVLEDEGVAYLLTLELPESFLDGDFVRLDGLFLKMYSEEDAEHSGTWVEGPLIVGPRAIRSYPALGTVTELQDRYTNPTVLYDEVLVRPDGTMNPDFEFGLPFEPLWFAMAYVRDLPEGAVDWAAARELDKPTLLEVMKDGQAHRLAPFRIPISRLQHATVKRATENPARIDYYTEGWLGNNMWDNVVFFMGPFEDREARLADTVTARGFFFRSFVYESAGRSVRVAPVFVLKSLDVFDPKPDPIFATVAYTLAGLAIVFIAVFVLQVRRDQRRSAVWREQQVQRRRARRERTAAEQANPPPP
ncbi:MAG: hypothetical protein AB1726_01930 [Planctomycetota bacterium]